jgi:gluconolactonase
MAVLSANFDVDYFVGSFGAGLDHPECIACGPDHLAYAGGEAGQIYRINTEQRSFEEYANTGGHFVGGIAVDADSNVYACSEGEVKRVTPEGEVTTYFSGSPDRPLKTPNYSVFDAVGNLYLSDSGDWKQDNGCLFKVGPDGAGTVWETSLTSFPNGLALAPSGTHLYAVMSEVQPRVSRVAIQDDGSAGTVSLVVELPEAVPDGLAFDLKGNLFVSCYRPDRIYRVAAEGPLDIFCDDPEGTMLAAPTNVAFCGENRDILLSANLGRWHISEYRTDSVGAPLHYPKLDWGGAILN